MTAAELAAKVATLEKKADALTGDRTVIEKSRTPKASEVFGQPGVRRGESHLTSRGYRFCNAIRANIEDDWSNAVVEKGMHDLLKGAFGSGVGNATFEAKTTLSPFGSELFPDDLKNDDNFGRRIKSLMYSGVEDADPNEIDWLRQKSYTGGTRKDMSWMDNYAGGALVGPPQQGELIDLFRNEAALMQCGVTTIPLPPNGRIQFPRQTTPTSAVWVGENTAATTTQPGTGLLTLSAKKLMAYTPLPNELIRYGGPAAEALIRKDLAATLALGVDLAGIQGVGSDYSPRGIINTPSVSTITPTTVASDGNTLAEGDVYSWMATVEAANGRFETFLMTPTMYYALLKRRSGAANATDAGGLFVFSPFRQLGDNVAQKNINGFRVVTSNQVSKTRVKGNGTTLTYIIGGMFSDCLLAMFGAVEFAVSNQAGDSFLKDQTYIRAIAIGDFGIRHPATMAVCDTLLQV